MPPKNQRWWLTTDHVELVVDAAPEQIYDLVADMPRMGEWSDECTTVEWENGDTGPAADARFVGHNCTGPRGIIRWSRHGRVLVADRGKEFAFVTEEGGHESTVWRYTFEAVDGGTRVTETYEAHKLPLWARIVDVPTNRHGALLKNMRHTLEQLKSAAEALSAPSRETSQPRR
jgi:hypothetical protein